MDAGEPKPGATPLDQGELRPIDTSEVKPPLEKPLPKRVEFVAEGSMGRISRVYYSDGSSRIAKNAKTPSFNRNLQKEYTFMLILADTKKAPAIPRVYDEFLAQNQIVDTYGFTMEDLRGYKGLRDLRSHTDLTVSLDTDDKMLILLDVVKALQYANLQGVIYNDVQLQNIMIDGRRTKLVDWANAQRLNDNNSMSDIQQIVELLPLLFNESELIPPSLRQWLSAVQKNQYKEPSVAWADFRRYWGKALTKEIPPIEQKRKVIFGSAHKSRVLPR